MSKKTLWETYTPEQKTAMTEFCEGYKDHLSACKTERECVTEMVKQAKSYGYEDLDEVIPSMDSEYKMGYYLTKELLREDKNLTAIVGMNDMIAFGIMDAVLESKLRIPADISVVGCDNTVYSSFRSISLTTIDHYVPLKGRDACDIILRKIQSLRESQDGKEPLSTYHVEYEPKLIVRRSTSYARTEKLKNK